MKIQPLPQVIPSPRTQEELLNWAQTVLLKIVRTELAQIRQAVNSLTLDNLNAKLITGATFTLANTEYSFSHDLGRVPQIVFPLITTNIGAVVTTLYKGPTAWTTSLIYMKSTLAAITADILVI